MDELSETAVKWTLSFTWFRETKRGNQPSLGGQNVDSAGPREKCRKLVLCSSGEMGLSDPKYGKDMLLGGAVQMRACVYVYTCMHSGSLEGLLPDCWSPAGLGEAEWKTLLCHLLLLCRLFHTAPRAVCLIGPQATRNFLPCKGFSGLALSTC